MTIRRLLELPGVQQAVQDARTAMDLLRSQRILRTKGTEVRAMAFGESVRAAAELGGMGIAETVELLESSVLAAPAIATSPMQWLARFHTIALSEHGGDRRGRPRDLDIESSQRLFALNDLLGAPADIPALLVAALVMAEISDIAPFVMANETVARTAFRSVLIGRGFDTNALGLPEVGMLALGATSFGPALAAYRTGTPDGVASWLRHLSSAVQLGARRGIEICDGLAT